MEKEIQTKRRVSLSDSYAAYAKSISPKGAISDGLRVALDCHKGSEPKSFLGWTVTRNPKPIPVRSLDWDFVHENYDGPECESILCGNASSFEDAIEQIIEIEIYQRVGE